MKRKILTGSIAVLSLLALAGCGQGGSSKKTVDVLVWCADAITTLTTSQLATVKTQIEALEAFDGYEVKFTVNPVGEGDAASNMINDVEAGADVFCFAQDQLARLYAAGALEEIKGSTKDKIVSENDAGAVSAATFSDKLVAYPLTSDNGYFLYYNKASVTETDIANWDTLLAKAASLNKEVHFNAGSAWYNFGFFYGAGADSVWTTNSAGKFDSYEDTYASANGLKAAKGLLKVVTHSSWVDNSDADKGFGGNAVAVVSGTWDYEKVKAKLGDNIGCAKLPKFTVGTEEFQTAMFSGNKLIGVKPQTDSLKAVAAQMAASYLTGEAAQLQRFNTVSWGPSNKVAQQNDAVKANPALVALAQQSDAKAKPQGQFPDAWWNAAGAIAGSLTEAGAGATDAQIQTILNTYTAALDGMLDA